MQVQRIQSTDSCRKPCFKAKFVNDVNGNFRRLWTAADKKENILKSWVRDFDGLPNHRLEILNIREPKLKNAWYAYDIFNHNTGKTKTFYSDFISEKSKLLQLLVGIGTDKEFFVEDEATALYKKLTDTK